MHMKKGIVIGALASGLALGATAANAATVEVANGTELAAAIVQANSDSSVTKILCATKNGCDVVGTLPTYTGSHALTIDGRFSTVDATGITDQDAFASTGGGLLKLIRLTFVGGMSGVYVEVPADQTGPSAWTSARRPCAMPPYMVPTLVIAPARPPASG